MQAAEDLPLQSEPKTLPGGKTAKYFIPHFVRGKVKGLRRGHPFEKFLKHWGVKNVSNVADVRIVHRTLTGYLNKYKLLFEEPIFKTYLHCMKKAYHHDLSETFKMIDFVKTFKAFDHRHSPWHRLCQRLESNSTFFEGLGKFLTKHLTVKIKVEPLEKLPKVPLQVESTCKLPDESLTPPAVKELEEPLAPPPPKVPTLRAYYGGPPTSFKLRGESETGPTYFNEKADIRTGAESLLEVFGHLKPSSGKYSAGVGYDGRETILDWSVVPESGITYRDGPDPWYVDSNGVRKPVPRIRNPEFGKTY